MILNANIYKIPNQFVAMQTIYFFKCNPGFDNALGLRVTRFGQAGSSSVLWNFFGIGYLRPSGVIMVGRLFLQVTHKDRTYTKNFK